MRINYSKNKYWCFKDIFIEINLKMINIRFSFDQQNVMS